MEKPIRQFRPVFIGISIVSVLIVGFLFMYTPPIETSEYATSPNTRYCARATTVTQHSLFAPQSTYQLYRITANACETGEDGALIWRSEYYPHEDDLLDYGARDRQFINWDASSAQVTIMIDKEQSITIPLP